MAANTDKLRKKKSLYSTTLTAGIDAVTTTIPLLSTSGLPTDTAITLTIDRVDGNGDATPLLVERVTGVISGNNLTNALRGQDGTSAQSHDNNAVVEDTWDADTWNDAVDTILEEHAQDGSHTDITGTSVTVATVTATGDVNVGDDLDVTGDAVIDGTASVGGDLTVAGELIHVDSNLLTGWLKVTDSWTYASATTITVPAGAASLYSVGDKIKLTQTTPEYFNIINVADTLLTVTGGSDYTVANAAITDIYVSKMQSPVGFPSHFNYTPTETGWSSNTIRKGWFLLNGRQCVVTVRLVGTSDTTSVAVGLPITAATITDMLWGGAAEYGADNNIDITGAIRYYVLSGGTTIVFHTNMANGGWTASSTKEVRATVSYLI